MWTIIAYVIVGLVGGSIAKSLMGKEKGTWVSTITLGIVGALLGGWLGGLLFNVHYYNIFSIKGVLFSVVGAVLVLAIQGWMAKRKA
ncbi:GlsB/YeaQ/YmgE family stress response membrane protein [Tessaracoccus caeni]|uniref:GlsB/YeaQ/YmgE family stress response membrane protein n=1 Tax=Tessaracoccus caeni TaxID=3031239 RepID=UPI0023DAD262|nr:GlsB/YeaQ/YmgE family stress response membrane protein [Tessaracoccus caeni]MDF1488346.1 GlsB/YeaQ/YmgE family stress response membrane protein [Tessaracoccus caeni]